MTAPTKTLRSLDDLVAAGLVEGERAQALKPVVERFQIAITPAMLGLIEDSASPADPIAAQFLPDPREAIVAPEELADPIGDAAHSAVPGIVHRYPDRVLLLPTHVCAVYCRFCFRRETVGPDGGTLSEAQLDAALGYIEARPEIFEVILSGGDPLVLSPRRIAEIAARLSAIEHVKVIRLHSRVPAVDPGRITAELVAALQSAKAVYVVLHVNHARELSAAAIGACARLIDAGIPMFAQTVLLKGINDDAATLEALFRSLLANRIKPYYLHHGDLAQGTSHRRNDLEAGQAIMRRLRGRLSGLAQPTYVLDIPGGHGKVPIGPGYVHRSLGSPGSADGAIEVEDPHGQRHPYPPQRD
ncbi:MAG: lysine-2,3-aminomutase-like protein [Rhodospirillales bacterium]